MKIQIQDIDDLEFHHILKNDKEAFTPPEESKEAVFAALNIGKYGKAPVAISTAARVKLLLKKAIIPVAAGLFIGVSTYLYNDNDANNAINEKIASETNATAKTESVMYSASQESSDNTILAENATRISKSIPIARIEKLSNQVRNNNFAPNSSAVNNINTRDYSYASEDYSSEINADNADINANLVDNTADVASLAQEAETMPISKKDYIELSGSSISVQNANNAMQGLPFAPFEQSSYISRGRSNDFELMMKGIGGSAVIADKMPINDFANSFTVGGYIPIKEDKSLLIGFVAGKEEYAKKYFNREDSRKLDYTATMPSLWFGISAKYRFDEVAAGSVFSFEPFAEVGLGAGEIGPLSRASVGIEKDIFSSISANISADFSSMFYNNRYDWFASKKFGISAGIVVKM